MVEKQEKNKEKIEEQELKTSLNQKESEKTNHHNKNIDSNINNQADNFNYNNEKNLEQGIKNQDELDLCKEKLKDYEETLKRLQADYENYKKRIDKQIQERSFEYLKVFLKELLSVVDDFELALESNTEDTNFYKGVEIIYSKLIDLLEKYDVKKIDTLNKHYDPYYHEALMTKVNNDVPENTVIEVMQSGYLFKNQVLRHARVVISKKEQEIKDKNNKSK